MRLESTIKRTLFACLFVVVGVGCGDDDGSVVDSGSIVDGGSDVLTDAAPPDADTGSPDTGMRMEDCSPRTSGSCETGKCSYVTERSDRLYAGGYWGCVDDAVAKAEGEPCDFTVDATPENMSDLLVADDCEQGLACFTGMHSDLRCQRLCDLDADCLDGETCGLVGDVPVVKICQVFAECEPIYQTGCAPGEGCYTILNEADVLVYICAAPFRPTATEGEECDSVNACEVGFDCVAATRDARVATCHAYCNAGEPPAMIPDTGFTGTCDGTCVPFTSLGLEVDTP